MRASNRCRPDASDSGSASDLATIVGQLRENAERYLLLADRYRFATACRAASPDVIEWTATVTFGELRPNLVVLDRVQAATVIDASRTGSMVLRRNEEQQLIDANIFPRTARDSLR